MADDKKESHTRSVQSTTGTPDVPESSPRLPHERDESSDSQQTEPSHRMRKAQADVESGRVDTDRGTPADDAYQKQKSSGATRP